MTRKVLLALCAVLPLAAAVPPSADARRGMEIALQDDGVFLYQQYYNRNLGLAQAQALGVTRLRVNVLWTKAIGPFAAASTTKPPNLAYNFTAWDNLIDAAARRGIRVTLTLAGQPVPAFATANRRQGQVRPNARRFGEFVRATVRHFKGRVNTYVIWNEPNHKAWLEPVRTQASVYRKLYIAGYRAIKRVDRRARVFIAETAPFSKSRKVATPPLKFLRQVTCANSRYHRRKRCKALVADGFAHHPYEFTSSPRHPARRFNHRDDVPLAGLSRLTRALDRLRKAHLLYGPRRRKLQLYLHEFGYFSGGRGKIFPEPTRARFLVQGFTIARRNPRVRTMLQYMLVRPPANHVSAYFDLSLVTLGGTRLGAFNALRAWASTSVKRRLIKRPRSAIRLPPARP
jgi:hypothetical protein